MFQFTMNNSKPADGLKYYSYENQNDNLQLTPATSCVKDWMRAYVCREQTIDSYISV